MRVYFDHNATSLVHPKVIDAMNDVIKNCYGNPSSIHHEGRMARQIVEESRKNIATLIQCAPGEITFTSGGTESNNSILLGLAFSYLRRKNRPFTIISSPLEHPSILSPLGFLKELGFEVLMVAVDKEGNIIKESLLELLKNKSPLLVSLSLCNHELGNIYPIEELTKLCHQYGAFVHCDAIQAPGRISINIDELGVDSLSLSGHKLGGPKGVGAFYLNAQSAKEFPLTPVLHGGMQEKGRRAGTENLTAIAGMGKAAQLAQTDYLALAPQVRLLRQTFENELLMLPGSSINGDLSNRIPGTSNIHFNDVDAELLQMNLDIQGIATSTGSACSSGSMEPSKVITALGKGLEHAKQSIRFSLGPQNTMEEVLYTVEKTRQAVLHLRNIRQTIGQF